MAYIGFLPSTEPEWHDYREVRIEKECFKFTYIKDGCKTTASGKTADHDPVQVLR